MHRRHERRERALTRVHEHVGEPVWFVTVVRSNACDP